jgi:hypothetical protein
LTNGFLFDRIKSIKQGQGMKFPHTLNHFRATREQSISNTHFFVAFLIKNKKLKNKFMDNKKEQCEILIKRRKELKGKISQGQVPSHDGNVAPWKITPVEMEELGDIEKEIKENCLEFLSIEEQWEIKNK